MCGIVRGAGVDPGVDFDTGRYAEGRYAEADGFINVAGGAVAAGKEQQIHPQGSHFCTGPAGIFRRCPAGPDISDDPGFESCLTGFHLAHLGWISNHLDLTGERSKAQKCLQGPAGGGRPCPELPGATEGFLTVAAFEPHASAHAGYRIYDNTHFFAVGVHDELE